MLTPCIGAAGAAAGASAPMFMPGIDAAGARAAGMGMVIGIIMPPIAIPPMLQLEPQPEGE